MVESLKQCRIALMLVIFFSVITGMLYPAVVTAIAQYFFPWRANGSIIFQDHRPVGSELIGQYFTEPKYFWGRPSVTQPFPYNSALSSGSNWGPMNAEFLRAVKKRIDRLQQADPQNLAPIPVDLVTASGSGLDPDISPLAAYYQVSRIAKARMLPVAQIQALVTRLIRTDYLGFLGDSAVNVLQLNIALNALDKGLQHKEG